MMLAVTCYMAITGNNVELIQSMSALYIGHFLGQNYSVTRDKK